MSKNPVLLTASFLIFAFLAIILLIAFFNFYDSGVTAGTDCQDLGCKPGFNYIASKNSNLYHDCTCHYARQIKQENMVCLKDDAEAAEKGLKKSDC